MGREEAERRLAAAGGRVSKALGIASTNMDKFVITGGTPFEGEIPTNGSKNSALPALAAALLTDEPVTLQRIPARARHPHHAAAAGGYRQRRWRSMARRVRLHTPQIVSPGSALRAGEDHARLQPGAGAAGGAQRTGAGFAAGRLRHRRAAHQSAHLRPGAAGRAHQSGARLHRSGSARGPARRDGALRPHHRDRHRRPDDGGGAGARAKPCCATRRASRKWWTWRRC